MPRGLKRYYGQDDLHYVTFSCYRRRPLLGTPRRRDCFLRICEQVRRRYRFVAVGYVVMPEHVHSLLSEPQVGTPSTVLQVLKQRVARRLRGRRKKTAQPDLFPAPSGRPQFWQRRFYDFNVWSPKKIREKLAYMHNNPVQRGLVSSPELWRWSSYRSYYCGERGLVAINQPFPE